MQPSPLDLYTSTELVQELVRRQTFLGVVVHSEDDLKNRDWKGERTFKVHFGQNLSAEEACRLLSVVTERMSDVEL